MKKCFTQGFILIVSQNFLLFRRQLNSHHLHRNLQYRYHHLHRHLLVHYSSKQHSTPMRQHQQDYHQKHENLNFLPSQLKEQLDMVQPTH